MADRRGLGVRLAQLELEHLQGVGNPELVRAARCLELKSTHHLRMHRPPPHAPLRRGANGRPAATSHVHSTCTPRALRIHALPVHSACTACHVHRMPRALHVTCTACGHVSSEASCRPAAAARACCTWPAATRWFACCCPSPRRWQPGASWSPRARRSGRRACGSTPCEHRQDDAIDRLDAYRKSADTVYEQPQCILSFFRGLAQWNEGPGIWPPNSSLRRKIPVSTLPFCDIHHSL
eukprot:scaffold113713_cov69-Phaeocystis_antarctica.AAC.1